MTNEELEQIYNCRDGGFGETSGKLSAHIKALEAENERLKKELNEVGNRERIFQDSLRKTFCEKQNLRKENAMLNEEREKLKETIRKCDFFTLDFYKGLCERLRKENTKLKCLVLHLFGHLGFYASEWYSDFDEERKTTKRAVGWWKIHLKCKEAYLKAKKALREGK